eukprot:2768817-Prymnesium_polylepis.1
MRKVARRHETFAALASSSADHAFLRHLCAFGMDGVLPLVDLPSLRVHHQARRVALAPEVAVLPLIGELVFGADDMRKGGHRATSFLYDTLY